MALQIFFGDDEHTGRDGAYARVLRTRKWLYFSAACVLFVHLGLYDAKALKELIRVFAVPQHLMFGACLSWLAYLLVQYGMLLVQLVATYDLVIRERFADAFTERVLRASSELRDARLARIGAETVLRNAQPPWPEGSNMEERRIELRAAEQSMTNAIQRQTDAAIAFDALESTNSATRRAYRYIDVCIDVLRVLPPFLFALLVGGIVVFKPTLATTTFERHASDPRSPPSVAR